MPLQDTPRPAVKAPPVAAEAISQLMIYVLFLTPFSLGFAVIPLVMMIGRWPEAGAPPANLWFLLLPTLIGVGLLVISIALIIGAWTELRDARRLDRLGVRTPGIVTDLWTVGLGEDSDFCVAYTFNLPNSGPHSAGERHKRPEGLPSLGSQVIIRYLPDTPSLCRMER